MDGDAATSADVVALLVAVERLVDAHRDELDALNVFPVPDADTGRNVLATVRAARAAAEQADPAARRFLFVGYDGTILAFGDVLRDQLLYMSRCGINGFYLRSDQDPQTCLAAFDLYTTHYQYT